MSRELLDATGAVFKNAGNGDCFFMALSQHLVLEEKWHLPPPLTIFFYRINFQFGKILPYKIFSLVTALPYKIFRFVTALPYSPGGLPKPGHFKMKKFEASLTVAMKVYHNGTKGPLKEGL